VYKAALKGVYGSASGLHRGHRTLRPAAAETAEDALVLASAMRAALACGVTRLADITHLDRIGVPVFQAIRPSSRALAVHQGKGLTPVVARIGALMESVESARAEGFDVRSAICSYAELSPAERPEDLGDFAVVRGDGPSRMEPLAWTAATRLVDGRAMLVPFDCVSLDCGGPWDRRLDHTSNGLASRLDLEGARLKGLLEVVERDAAAAWVALDPGAMCDTTIDETTIPYGWFRGIADRLEAAGIRLSLYWIPSLIGVPAFRAEILELGALPSASASAGGWGCGLTCEDAVRAAVLEALQSRLTLIAGARDDILYDEDGGGPGLGYALPLPPGLDGLAWSEITDSLPDAQAMTSSGLAERLAQAGYPDACEVRLSAPDDPVCVVKVFAPGLGCNRRVRRAAVPG
jgi:ribosomal protein S12 methylthiotransferase accessory factor